MYHFDSDVEGFQNVSWQATAPVGWSGLPGTVMSTHTTGGWQMQLVKEFDWQAGGGQPNQQVAMQQLANLGPDARLSFDIMVDGASFTPDISSWFQLNTVGNSDGSQGWTQSMLPFPTGWHEANNAQLITLHVDQPFSYWGWEPGDNWFQLWIGSNSDGAMTVNFYLDNVMAYVIPEPGSATLFGVGLAVLLALRRRP